jgi:plasmid stabilization system protein ParE
VTWTKAALADLVHLHSFLASADRQSAARTTQSLAAAPARLIRHPRIGERLDEFTDNEVRRIVIGRYEMRYEVRPNRITILRLWHTREDR